MRSIIKSRIVCIFIFVQLATIAYALIIYSTRWQADNKLTIVNEGQEAVTNLRWYLASKKVRLADVNQLETFRYYDDAVGNGVFRIAGKYDGNDFDCIGREKSNFKRTKTVLFVANDGGIHGEFLELYFFKSKQFPLRCSVL